MKFALFALSALLFVASAFALDGSISVLNNGKYIAVLSVDFVLNGKGESGPTITFPSGVTADIGIPDGATNVNLKVQEYWYAGPVYTIFTKKFDGPVHKCYKIWGTSLKPQYDEITC